jgi:NRPS condensation-like uncharacterized protein
MSRGRPRRADPGRPPRAPFGPIDELNCYFDTRAEPNNIHLEVQVPGTVDYPALRGAVAGALAAAPRARGRMADGGPFRCRYTWEFPPVPDADPLSHAVWSGADELAELRTRFLASAPPLRTSPPVRLLLASGPGSSCVILNAHHAAMDGMSSLELLRDIAARYRAIAGAPASPLSSPALSSPALSSPALSSPATPGAAPPPGGPGRARGLLRYPVARIAAERERPASRDGYGLRLLAVPGIPRAPGATVNDTLIAALAVTISRWNAAHRRRPGAANRAVARAIAVTVPVNVRDPGLRGVAGNQSRLATVTVDPRTAAGDLPRLLAAVTRQTSALRQAPRRRPSAGALGRAPRWCPVALRRLAVRFALGALGRVVCDTCMLTNLGDVTDPPWSGCGGPVRMTLSGPAHLPRGLSVAAVTADGQLRLAFRYQYALFDEAAAARFTAGYAAALDELTSGARPRRDEGGDTRGPAGAAAQDSRLPRRQGRPVVLRRRGSAVQPAAETRLPD